MTLDGFIRLEGTGRIHVKVAVLGEEGTLEAGNILLLRQNIKRSCRNEPQNLLCRFPLIGRISRWPQSCKISTSILSWPFSFLFFFIYYWLHRGLFCCVRAFSRCGQQWLLCCGAGALERRLSKGGTRAQLLQVHVGSSRDQGWDLCPRHW